MTYEKHDKKTAENGESAEENEGSKSEMG